MSDARTAISRLIRDREFIKIWSTGALNMTMRWMDILVVGVYTQQTTQSALLVAIMLFLRLIPSLLFGVFVGALAERLNRQRLLTFGLCVGTMVYVVLFVLAWSGQIELWHIGVGAFLSGLFWSFEYPTRRTLLGEAAGFARVGNAMSLDAASNHASRMVGPALGGALLETTGLAGPFFCGIVLTAIATLNIALLKRRHLVETTSQESTFNIIRSALAYVKTNRLVQATLAVTVTMNFFGFSYAALVPVIGATKYQLGALPIGLLASMEGIGALIGSVIIAFWVTNRWFPRVFSAGTVLFLSMILLFSMSPSYSFCLIVLLFAGVAIGAFSSMQSALIYSATPQHLRRRIMGLLVVCIGTGPLGVLHTGLMASWLAADTTITIISCEGLIVLLLCLRCWPELLRPTPASSEDSFSVRP